MIKRNGLIAAVLGAALLAGCVAPNGTVITPRPGGGVVVTPPPGGNQVDVALNGLWCVDGRNGRVRERQIDIYRDGMVVTNRRGRQREYRRLRAGRYREVGGDSMYVFRNRNNGVFSRDGREVSAVPVYRCT